MDLLPNDIDLLHTLERLFEWTRALEMLGEALLVHLQGSQVTYNASASFLVWTTLSNMMC